MKKKSNALKFLFAVASAAMITACGSGNQNQGSISSTNFFYVNGIFRYELTDASANCQTGAHQLDSLSALCAALESNSLNNNCGAALRSQNFEQAGCPGTFQQTP